VSERIDPDRPDEAALAEYLKGGSAVSQRYREVSSDEVPADLDRRVLEMARVPSPNRKWIRGPSPFLRRWSAPLALAASTVLVVSIVIESGVHEGVEPVASERTAPRPAAAPPPAEIGLKRALEDVQSPSPPALQPEEQKAAPPAAPATARREKAADVAASARRAQQLMEQTASAVSTQRQELATGEAHAVSAPDTDLAKAQAPASDRPAASSRETYTRASDSSDELGEIAVTGSTMRRDAAGGSGPRNTIRRQAAPAYEEERDAAGPPRTPEVWLEEIRELRKQGREREADEEWRGFRKTHPDYVVPDDDRARPSE
jgi:hypothetical protein